MLPSAVVRFKVLVQTHEFDSPVFSASSVVLNLRISALASIFLPAVLRSRFVSLSNYVEITEDGRKKSQTGNPNKETLDCDTDYEDIDAR